MNMYYSQACQDLFVEKMTQGKHNGCFVEIGSNHPITHNNSYLLESKYNWKGLMVEYDNSFEESYKTQRKNSIYVISDARSVNYKAILDTNQFPKQIDYLQIDLDVDNRSTLDTFLLLNNTVFDRYKFATITFEHDIYRGNYFDTQNISRKILLERGYILVFPNVSVFWEGSFKPFEDWYVHPDLVDMNIVNKVLTTKSLNTNEITSVLTTL
jgi:hypothetical protein